MMYVAAECMMRRGIDSRRSNRHSCTTKLIARKHHSVPPSTAIGGRRPAWTMQSLMLLASKMRPSVSNRKAENLAG